MRYKPEHKAASREILLKAAGAQFRERGFGGVGVDGLAAAAGMTSGAFYKHFRSKTEVFNSVLAAGLQRLVRRLNNVAAADRSAPDVSPVDEFIAAYMNERHRDAVGAGCALPALTAEAARGDAETRAVYQEGLLEAVETMIALEPLKGNRDARERALAILVLVAGGVSMARACADPQTAEWISEAARKAASHIAHTGSVAGRDDFEVHWEPLS